MDQTSLELVHETKDQDEEKSLTNNSYTYFENALSKIPAFDIGYVRTKANEKLKFSWQNVDSRGRQILAKCEVNQVTVKDSDKQTLPGDAEHDVFMFVIDRFIKTRPKDGWVEFHYDDVGKFLGYTKSSYNDTRFHREVKNAVRVLRNANITATNAWTMVGGNYEQRETTIDFFKNYDIIERKGEDSGRGFRDTIKVLLGDHFIKNISNNYVSLLPDDVLASLKGTSALRRLAHIISSRAQEAGRPEILQIYFEELTVSMSIPSEWPEFRAKVKLKRLFSRLVTSKIISEEPIYEPDSNRRTIVVVKPIYHFSEKHNASIVEEKVANFLINLKKYLSINASELGINSKLLTKLIELHSEVEMFDGIPVPRVFAFAESILQQYSGKSPSKGFPAMLSWALKNPQEFNYFHPAFEPVVIKAAKDKKKIDREKLEERKESDEAGYMNAAQSIFADHKEYLREYYQEEIRVCYSKTKFGNDRYKRIISDQNLFDRECVMLLKRDLRLGKNPVLPKVSKKETETSDL